MNNLDAMRMLYDDNMTEAQAAEKWADLMAAYGVLNDFMLRMEDLTDNNEKMENYMQDKRFQLGIIAEIATSPENFLHN